MSLRLGECGGGVEPFLAVEWRVCGSAVGRANASRRWRRARLLDDWRTASVHVRWRARHAQSPFLAQNAARCKFVT